MATKHQWTNAMNTTFESLDAARAYALAQSKDHPRLYITIQPCFGWVVTSVRRLSVFAPSDSTEWTGRTGTYWLNGHEKPFSQKQIIADQNATPDTK